MCAFGGNENLGTSAGISVSSTKKMNASMAVARWVAEREGFDFRHFLQVLGMPGHSDKYPVFMHLSSTFSISGLLPATTSHDLY